MEGDPSGNSALCGPSVRIPLEDVQLLYKVLTEKFGLDSVIRMHKGSHIIYVLSGSRERRADVVQTTSAYGACVSYDTYAPNGPSALEKLRAERWHTDRMCHMTHTIRSLMLFAQHQQGLP
jgi:hypothetical protein